MERQINKLSRGNLFVIIAAIIIIVGLFLVQPERSVANFCRVAKEEKSILTGDVNYQQRLDSYKKLEAVSPDAIHADMTTIRKGYEVIVDDPSKTINAGLGMTAPENRRTAYIKENCPNF